MIANVELSTKEQLLLQDQKSHEEQCVIKYDNYANLACDVQLKAVFRSNGQNEKEHLQTINQLLNGKIPSMAGQSQNMQDQSNQSGRMNQQSQASQGGQASQGAQASQGGISWQQQAQGKDVQGSSSGNMLSDKDMCTDMLNTEKYVSGTYDTAIFEFKNAQIRDVLNHIQKEEQKHGEAIFTYMQSKGMYSAQ